MPPEKQSDFIAHIRKWYDDAESWAIRLKESDPEDFKIQPEPGKWSAGQSIAHVVTALEIYEPLFEEALGKTEASNKADSSAHSNNQIRFGALGKFLFFALNPEKPRNVPAPKKFHGPVDAGVEQLGLFLAKLNILRGFLTRAEKFDLVKNKMNNPAIPLMKLRFCDAFQVHAWHNVRHFEQAERALEKAKGMKQAA